MNKSTCFHCGLPVLEQKPPRLEVLGEQRSFCCHGCKAVCEAIVSSGNEDYYRHREGTNRTANANLNTLIGKLKLYDNEQLQREFIRQDKQGGWKEAWLILEEIRCAACLWLNERTLRSLDGVLDVQMDYTGQQARVRWNPDKIKLSDILAAISNIGYYAHPFDPTQRESLNQEQKQRSLHRILFALILGMAVMQSAIGSYFMGAADAQGEFPLWLQISRWVNVGSTFLLLAYPGQLFFRNAWRDLKNRTLGMDVPVVIGLSVAWLGSLYSTIRGTDDVYFESIAMFVLFLLVARHIELRTRITATALLDRAARIIPQTAHRIEASGVVEVPVIELNPGDKIRLSPGETVPVDGRLLSKKSSFDESLLTGESLPVSHLQGDKILGGSINVEQLVELEVESGRADSTLNELNQLTQKSINYRPYYVDIAESVAGRFVAVILLIATGTFLYWSMLAGQLSTGADALSHTIAVLIVTCPCALALAAPVALSLGAAGLSRLHLLAIRMSSIEQMSHIDTLVFDKTGTLTAGNPVVNTMLVTGNLEQRELLRIAASMEQGSQHPFAKALVSSAEKAGIELTAIDAANMEQFTGQGIAACSGTFENDTNDWRLGNLEFVSGLLQLNDPQLKQNALDRYLTEEQAKQVHLWRGQGDSTLYLANQQGVQAIFCLTDPLRPGIEEFVRQSEDLGIRHRVILSGDHQQSVSAVARQLGINEDDAHGGLSPHDKLAWIRRHHEQSALHHQGAQRRGRKKIMMIGDGINDAPTLAAADVSMTFAEATDLARSNSDFILLGKDYTMLADAFRLMRKTRRIILQNLGWAIGYNVIAVPAATMGLVTPWMAAIGMSLSSLLVVLNSLRLKKGNTV